MVGGNASFGSTAFRSTVCVTRQHCRKGTDTSKVKSVVGMYIRGEKKMEEIVHPSKISRKLWAGTPRLPTSFRSSSVNVVANLSSFVYPSMEDVKLSPQRSHFELELVEEPPDPVDVVPEVTSVAGLVLPLEDVPPVPDGPADPPAVRVADVDRIDFEGEDVAIKLKPVSPRVQRIPDKVEESKVECSIRPSRPRDSELDLVIAPSKQHVVSEMLLEDKQLKLQVRPIDTSVGPVPSGPLRGGRSRKSRSSIRKSSSWAAAAPSRASSQMQLALLDACDAAKMASYSMNFSNVCLETKETSAGVAGKPVNSKPDVEKHTEPRSSGPEITAVSSGGTSSAKKPAKPAAKVQSSEEKFALPETQLKPLKTDVYYYREKVAHERRQIDDLNKQIGRAETLFSEYEQQKLKLVDDCEAHREEFERLLQDFRAVSGATSKSTATNAEADAGLDRLITNYFVKYYDSVAKKIDQFNRERSALSMVIGNLSDEQTQLQNHVSHFEQRLAKIS